MSLKANDGTTQMIKMNPWGEDEPAQPNNTDKDPDATARRKAHEERIATYENLKKEQEQLLELQARARKEFFDTYSDSKEETRNEYKAWMKEATKRGIQLEANPNYKYKPAQDEYFAKINEKRLMDDDNAHVELKRVNYVADGPADLHADDL